MSNSEWGRDQNIGHEAEVRMEKIAKAERAALDAMMAWFELHEDRASAGSPGRADAYSDMLDACAALAKLRGK